MSLWLSSCCLLKGWWDWVTWSADHAPCDGIGLERLGARFSRPGRRGTAGMGRLRTVCNIALMACPL
eukprot:366378-Chlamydomonas_euryale.AAC.10